MASGSPLALARQEPGAAALLLVAGLIGWVFLFWAGGDMRNPLAQLMMPMDSAWSASNFVAVFVMWAVMMMAMMLPAAAPMILTITALYRNKRPRHRAWLFSFAYLLIWTAFSAAATILQWALHSSGLITPMMASRSVWLTVTLLLVAGVVQFAPLKDVCLRHCRTPMGFLLTEWRDGAAGASIGKLLGGVLIAAGLLQIATLIAG